jgi:hypothetical protein
MLAFTSVYFFESGLFNRLRSIRIKIFRPLVSGYVQPQLRRHEKPAPPSFLRPIAIVIPWILNFCKILQSFDNGVERPLRP